MREQARITKTWITAIASVGISCELSSTEVPHKAVSSDFRDFYANVITHTAPTGNVYRKLDWKQNASARVLWLRTRFNGQRVKKPLIVRFFFLLLLLLTRTGLFHEAGIRTRTRSKCQELRLVVGIRTRTRSKWKPVKIKYDAATKKCKINTVYEND